MMVTRGDYFCRRRHQVLDKLGLNRAWFRELSAYYRHMTVQEFWVRYTLGRMNAATLWERKPRTSESDYRSFYAETDYFVLRHMYHSRNECYHVIADSMRPAEATGDFCEYGSGVAPITAWLRPRFPRWRYSLVDLPTPMFEFARWRFRELPVVETREPGLGTHLPLTREYDVITCMDVLEHVINPLQIVRHMAAHLTPGGVLHVNFIHAPGGENLVESVRQGAEAIDWMDANLRGVIPLRAEGPNKIYARNDKPR